MSQTQPPETSYVPQHVHPYADPSSFDRARWRRKAVTSVHALETPEQDDVDSEYVPSRTDERLAASFRHSGWESNRRRVFDALHSCISGKDHRIRAFASCGQNAVVLQSVEEPNKYRLGCQCCHDRFCLPCQKTRSRVLLTNLDAVIEKPLAKRNIRFITLTLRHDGTALVDQLNKLYAAWKALRKRPIWRNTQRGGAGFLEVKISGRSGDWHAHLHVLTEGAFMPKAQLSKAWLDITGDSFVVDIRRPTTHGDVAKYVTKYVTKGFSGEVYRDHNRLAEAIDALHGRRLVITFGTWNGYRLFATVVPDGWSRYCELSYAIKKAREGNPHYTQILVLLRADWDTVAWNADATTWIGRDPDDDEPD